MVIGTLERLCRSGVFHFAVAVSVVNAVEQALEVVRQVCDEAGVAIPLIDIGPRRVLVDGDPWMPPPAPKAIISDGAP